MRRNWYVLHVVTGSELEVQRRLKMEGIESFVIQETALIRRGGRWHEEARVWFPGYVFVFIVLNARMHYQLKGVPCTIRLLPKDDPVPLSPKDCARLPWCGGEILSPSTVDFSSGEPVVVEGPLLSMRDYIVKYDRHRRKVLLRVPVFDEHKDVTLSILPV